MFFVTKSGRIKRIPNPSQYQIDWNGVSKSKFQFATKQFLRTFWANDYVFEEFRVCGTKMHFDFYNHTKRIVVEAQGRQHYKHVPHFHGKTGLKDQFRRDLEKIDFCAANNIAFVEIGSETELTVDFFQKLGITL